MFIPIKWPSILPYYASDIDILVLGARNIKHIIEVLKTCFRSCRIKLIDFNLTRTISSILRFIKGHIATKVFVLDLLVETPYGLRHVDIYLAPYWPPYLLDVRIDDAIVDEVSVLMPIGFAYNSNNRSIRVEFRNIRVPRLRPELELLALMLDVFSSMKVSLMNLVYMLYLLSISDSRKVEERCELAVQEIVHLMRCATNCIRDIIRGAERIPKYTCNLNRLPPLRSYNVVFSIDDYVLSVAVHLMRKLFGKILDKLHLLLVKATFTKS